MKELLQGFARICLAQQRSNFGIVGILLRHLVSEDLEHLGRWLGLCF